MEGIIPMNKMKNSSKVSFDGKYFVFLATGLVKIIVGLIK